MIPDIIRSSQRTRFIGPIRNGFERDLAEERARRIRAVWANCGHKVDVWIEPLGKNRTSWVVRSNLINGMPPRRVAV